MKLKTINFSIRFPIFLGIQKQRNRKENQKEKKKVPIKLTSLICELIRNPKISHTMNERE